jgi:hypothetical protein
MRMAIGSGVKSNTVRSVAVETAPAGRGGRAAYTGRRMDLAGPSPQPTAADVRP